MNHLQKNVFDFTFCRQIKINYPSWCGSLTRAYVCQETLASVYFRSRAYAYNEAQVRRLAPANVYVLTLCTTFFQIEDFTNHRSI